jgi:hypothetical protein
MSKVSLVLKKYDIMTVYELFRLINLQLLRRMTRIWNVEICNQMR